jgi:hypothetical protein
MSENNQWSLTFRYVVGVMLFAAFVAFVFYAHDAVRNFVLCRVCGISFEPGG